MKKILITGSNGFIGKHLSNAFQGNNNIEVLYYNSSDNLEKLEDGIRKADIIYHLAGVNRPKNDEEFATANVELTKKICNIIKSLGVKPLLVFSSSIQSSNNTAYGNSKFQAEKVLEEYNEKTKNPVVIFRLQNVFGKGGRPNYNSVVATFCYNIANNLPTTVSNLDKELNLIYIDDVIKHFLKLLDVNRNNKLSLYDILEPNFKVTVEQLFKIIYSFKDVRDTGELPNLSRDFIRYLYATYLSYLKDENLSYQLNKKIDSRGYLAEFLKGESFGTIFVSKTSPGVTRGNHSHKRKTEKFLVLEGDAAIRLRDVASQKVIEYNVKGEDSMVIDIPTGFTHSIKNVGKNDLITLFWCGEPFNPNDPDIYPLQVIP